MALSRCLALSRRFGVPKPQGPMPMSLRVSTTPASTPPVPPPSNRSSASARRPFTWRASWRRGSRSSRPWPARSRSSSETWSRPVWRRVVRACGERHSGARARRSGQRCARAHFRTDRACHARGRGRRHRARLRGDGAPGAKSCRRHGLPVVEGVAAAVRLAEAIGGLGLATSKRGLWASPLPKPYTGIFANFAPTLPRYRRNNRTAFLRVS